MAQPTGSVVIVANLDATVLDSSAQLLVNARPKGADLSHMELWIPSQMIRTIAPLLKARGIIGCLSIDYAAKEWSIREFVSTRPGVWQRNEVWSAGV